MISSPTMDLTQGNLPLHCFTLNKCTTNSVVKVRVCINCGNAYHAGCLKKLKNTVLIKGFLIKCCESKSAFNNSKKIDDGDINSPINNSIALKNIKVKYEELKQKYNDSLQKNNNNDFNSNNNDVNYFKKEIVTLNKEIFDLKDKLENKN